ncbi:MAG: hypothetical protein MUF87_17340 [Anaerolineae bacterium]|jgi:hypothetical protein|nr:hypothetical protein [Anaerolineae bacterium]
MGTLRASLEQLAALTVNGVRGHYGIDAVPRSLSRAQLPALVVLPIENETDDRFFPDRGEGFRALEFSNTTRTITYAVTHLLLVAPKGDERQTGRLIDLIDSYFLALSAQVTLNDTLLHPARVRAEIGVFTYGDGAYYGCALRHLWTIAIN